MREFKITMNYETTIKATDDMEAYTKFWDKMRKFKKTMNYQMPDFEEFLKTITEITEVE